jgi:hypothetical protein
MTYFIGNVGNVRLRRNNNLTFSAIVKNADTIQCLIALALKAPLIIC